MLVRIVPVLTLLAIVAAPPTHAAMPPPHATGGVGPGIVGGPVKQQSGVVLGKPILKPPTRSR
jgi:hypothetical protein